VTCFGQQKKEEKNYMEFLKEARDMGMKSLFGNSVGTGVFISSFLILYTYALFIGTVYINQRLINPLTDKVYTSGDVLACFFGVIFGMFSLGMITPNLKAVAEGKAAAKAAFEILDRTPEIQSNTGASPKL
jgi:ATP-binding cassette, subfamily B (MDR/TAP), member 1